MIRIAIVDDDRNMLSIVRKNIEIITGMKDSTEVHEFTDAKEVIDALAAGKKYEIIISDIEMEDMQGLEFGKIVREKYPEIFLTFLTAYPHYAAKSYAINAHQYILKNEMCERLPVVLNDFVKQIEMSNQRYRSVTKGKETYKLMFRDIIYIRKMKSEKYIQYKTLDGEYLERISLEHILKELDLEHFLMIERGYIVNVDHIDHVKGRTIYLDNDEELTISRGKYAEVREKLHTCWRG